MHLQSGLHPGPSWGSLQLTDLVDGNGEGGIGRARDRKGKEGKGRERQKGEAWKSMEIRGVCIIGFRGLDAPAL